MNYIFEIIELNKFTNDLRTLYKNYFNKWVEYGGDPLTALHASTISTNEKVISDISKIFKEDITRVIWRAIVRGRPKWRFQFKNSITKDKIASQYIWLEYTSFKRLPKAVRRIFSKRRHQNKQAAQWLHFASDTQVNAKEFLPGYDTLQQTMQFSLAPFARYLKRGEGKLYHLDSNKISKKAVERRYQLNVVLVFTQSEDETLYQRYKITLNRSKIVNIERIYSQTDILKDER